MKDSSKKSALTFDKSQQVTVAGKLVTNIPDGYKYSKEGTGGNENWLYIVPDNYPLDADHVEAEPFSFGIIHIPVDIQTTVDADKIEGCKNFLLKNNAMDPNIVIHDFICSEHCFFLYQKWADSNENMFNKVNGFIFANDKMHQFHAFMNHDKPVSNHKDVIKTFDLTYRQWMKNVVLLGDSPYKSMSDPDEVKETLNDLSRMFVMAKEKMIPSMPDNLGDDLREIYAQIIAMFYSNIGKEMSAADVKLASRMIGTIGGKEVTKEYLISIAKNNSAKTTLDVIRGFKHDRVLKNLVIMDKLSNAGTEGGLTKVHFIGVEILLKTLCAENGIDYYTSEFCYDCVENLRDLWSEKWEENDAYMMNDSTMVIRQTDGISTDTFSMAEDSFDMTDDVEMQKSMLNRQVEELKAQADLYSTQNLSAEDRETLAQAQEGIDKLGKQLNEISDKQDIFAEHTKRQEEEKKKREEEKKRKKAEMLEKLNEDDVTIDMFVILSNESKLGMLKRKQDDFFKTYEEDFPTLNKKEMAEKRKELREKMKDKELCAAYTEKFKQRSLKERFDLSTRNYFNLSNNIEESMNATAEWYERNEYPELRSMLEEHIGNQRKKLDDQIEPVEKKWTKFSTAQNDLEIVIKDDADVLNHLDKFQMKLEGALVEVNLNSGGIYQLMINVMNCFTWYWDMDVASIWELALKKNNAHNIATSYFDEDELANEAVAEIKKKYPLRNKDYQDKSHRFIRMVLDEYEGESLGDNSTNAIKEMMDKCFEDERAFSESRRYIAQDKDLSKIPALKTIIDCGIPASMAYKEIPEALGAEIIAINKEKLVKKKEQDIEETEKSLSDESLTGLLKSIELLNGLKKYDDADNFNVDNQRIDDLIKICSDKAEYAKEKQYQDALGLIDDCTTGSLTEAIELMEGLGDYKDSAKKAEKARSIMGDEILYSEAISNINEGSAESFLSAMKSLEALRDYKDSVDLLADIRNKFNNVIVSFNEKAQNLLMSGDRKDVDSAADIYEYIKTVDFDETRISLYEERLNTIESLRSFYDELRKLKDEHANLGGIFKKRQRLENEEKTRETEGEIANILASIE